MRSTESLLVERADGRRDVGAERRRRAVVVVTLVAGTALLRATLALRSGSLAFGASSPCSYTDTISVAGSFASICCGSPL